MEKYKAEQAATSADAPASIALPQAGTPGYGPGPLFGSPSQMRDVRPEQMIRPLPPAPQGTVTGRFPSPVTTMSSREIAELTGKRHDNVVADIRKMLDELGKAAPEFSGTALVPGPNNSMRPVPVFNLPKDLTLTLVSGYNVTLRHRIVTRWMELEEQAVKPALPTVSSDPLDLLLVQAQMFPKLIAEMQEQKRAQAAQAEALEAQAEKLARYLETSKSVTSRSSGSPARASQDT